MIRPAREPETRYERLESLCEHFFRYLELPVFPGGCFFASAAAELDTHPGPVKERLAQSLGGWMGLLERRAREAQEAGEIDPAEDPALLAFELEAFMKMAQLAHGAPRGRQRFRQRPARGAGAARARPRDEAVTIRPHALLPPAATGTVAGCTVSSPLLAVAGILGALLLIWRGSAPGAARARSPTRSGRPGVLNPDVSQATIGRDDLHRRGGRARSARRRSTRPG